MTFYEAKMGIKMGVCWFILWLVTLTTTAQGYKSCSEIAAAKTNPPHEIVFNQTSYNVQCNMTANPVTTTIKVRGTQDDPNFYVVIYETVPKEAIRQLVMVSESCEQSVSYDCKNDALFTNNSIQWFNVDETAVFDWGTCDGKCKCEDSGKTEMRILTKENGIPVYQFDKSPDTKEINVTIGDIVCYGDNKDAVTFKNRGSLSTVNLTADAETISFKFKLSGKNKNVIVAVIKLENDQYIKVGVDGKKSLFVEYKTNKEKAPIIKRFKEVDEGWHKIEIKMANKNVGVSVDGGPTQAVMENTLEAPRVKLMFGEKDCRSFIGCLKDVYVGGEDSTKQLLSSPDVNAVVKGCQKIVPADCDLPPDVSPPGPGNDEDNNDADDDDDDDDNTAVIVIVVILLLLLILIFVAFFITWYLKRNKGMYQTHEGSAEDVHGDTDNLTLVTKPSEQDPDGQKSKEYYL